MIHSSMMRVDLNTSANMRNSRSMRMGGARSAVVYAAGKTHKITLLPGDGIGPEILTAAVKVI